MVATITWDARDSVTPVLLQTTERKVTYGRGSDGGFVARGLNSLLLYASMASAGRLMIISRGRYPPARLLWHPPAPHLRHCTQAERARPTIPFTAARQHGKAIEWLVTGSDRKAPSFSSHPPSRSSALAHTSRGADASAMLWWMGDTRRNDRRAVHDARCAPL